MLKSICADKGKRGTSLKPLKISLSMWTIFDQDEPVHATLQKDRGLPGNGSESVFVPATDTVGEMFGVFFIRCTSRIEECISKTTSHPHPCPLPSRERGLKNRPSLEGLIMSHIFYWTLEGEIV